MDGYLFEFFRQDFSGARVSRQAIAIAASEAAALELLGPFDAVLAGRGADVLERGRGLGIEDNACKILPRDEPG